MSNNFGDFRLAHHSAPLPSTRLTISDIMPPTAGFRVNGDFRLPLPQAQTHFCRLHQQEEQRLKQRDLHFWSERRCMYPLQQQRHGQSVMAMQRPFSFRGSTPSFRSQQLYRDESKLFCSFCKTNGESRQFYTSHRLRESSNRVTCPVLRRYVCRFCAATGDNAHTDSYCPKNPNSGFKFSMRAILSTPHNSCGLRKGSSAFSPAAPKHSERFNSDQNYF